MDEFCAALTAPGAASRGRPTDGTRSGTFRAVDGIAGSGRAEPGTRSTRRSHEPTDLSKAAGLGHAPGDTASGTAPARARSTAGTVSRTRPGAGGPTRREHARAAARRNGPGWY